jgi:hypothetical protein
MFKKPITLSSCFLSTRGPHMVFGSLGSPIFLAAFSIDTLTALLARADLAADTARSTSAAPATWMLEVMRVSSDGE